MAKIIFSGAVRDLPHSFEYVPENGSPSVFMLTASVSALKKDQLTGIIVCTDDGDIVASAEVIAREKGEPRTIVGFKEFQMPMEFPTDPDGRPKFDEDGSLKPKPVQLNIHKSTEFTSLSQLDDLTIVKL